MLAYIVIIVESIVIILSLFQIIKDFYYKKKVKKNTLYILNSMIEFSQNLKNLKKPDLAFEIERQNRRFVLLIQNKELQIQSLFWFYENGIAADYNHIRTALKHNYFVHSEVRSLANEILSKV